MAQGPRFPAPQLERLSVRTERLSPRAYDTVITMDEVNPWIDDTVLSPQPLSMIPAPISPHWFEQRFSDRSQGPVSPAHDVSGMLQSVTSDDV